MKLTKLDHSRPLDLLYECTDTRLERATEYFLDELEISDTRANRKHLQHWLQEFALTLKHDKQQYIGYSRDKAWWASIRQDRSRNPQQFSSKFIEIADAFIKAGLVHHHVGHKNMGKKDRRLSQNSKIRPNGDLRGVLRERGLDKIQIQPVKSYPVLRMRNKKKQTLNVNSRRIPKAIQQSADVLRRYNAFIAKQDISLDIPTQTVMRDKKSVYRMFNNSDWNQGGRLYGAWWIHCKSKLRPKILINGDYTTELDYSSQHPCLLYEKEGVKYLKENPAGKFYVLEDEFGDLLPKAVVKNTFLCSLNADDDMSAWRATQARLRKYAKKEEMTDAETKALLSEIHDLDSFIKILNGIYASHPKLEKYKFKGVGTELMNTDSRICLYVLDEMTQKGIPCLSVHDSFVVPQFDAETLQKVMQEAYVSLGIPDALPKIPTLFDDEDLDD